MFEVIYNIHKHFQSPPALQLLFLSQVTRLIKFVLLMPATNAISERTLNHDSVMDEQWYGIAYSHLTDSIDVVAVLNEFVSVNEDRRKSLGYFHWEWFSYVIVLSYLYWKILCY